MPKLCQSLGLYSKNWICLLLLLIISWNYIAINGWIDGASLYYPYDIPSITFFSIGLTLFLKSKWIWFYPVFVLSLLNRESACFISLAGFLLQSSTYVHSFQRWFSKNKSLLMHILIQALLWLTSRIILSFVFKDNPGLYFEEPHSMFEFISLMFTGGSHWSMNNPLWYLTIFLGIWIIPILYAFKLNSIEKRLCLFCFFYVSVLYFRSNMMEVRIFNELNLVVFLLSISICHRKISFSQKKSTRKTLVHDTP